MRNLVLIAMLGANDVAGAYDGSGWTHASKSDGMDDSISCTVQPRLGMSPYVWFFYHSVEGPSASVIGDDYPGEDVEMRVDQHRMVSGREHVTGASLQAVVNQIRAGGRELKVRFIEWPSGAPVLLTYDLTGIVEHLDACKAAVRGGK